MPPVFLIGFMGTGKTTLGRAMQRFAASAACPAPLRGLRFVDLDELIEQQEGMSITDIFKHKGEPYFRLLESSMLHEAASQTAGGETVIVGCGGGTPCQTGCMEWMNANGITVKLEASTTVLARRLREATGQRPLIDALPDAELERFIAEKQAEREQFYSLAHLRFRSDQLESEAEIEASCRTFASLIMQACATGIPPRSNT